MKTGISNIICRVVLIIMIVALTPGCMENKNNIVINWDNGLILPPCGGMAENIGLAGVFSGFSGGKLMIAGGANFPEGYPWEDGIKRWWNTLYVLDPVTGKWDVYEDFLPKATAYGASVQLPEGILCVGGSGPGEWYDDIALLKFDGGEPSWNRESWRGLPYPLANVSAVMSDGVLYAAGENKSADPTRFVYISLDTADMEAGWKLLPPCPGQSGNYTLCAARTGRVFALSKRVYGEGNNIDVATDGYSYDPAEGTWTRLYGDFPPPAGTAFPYGEDKIVFLGGADKLLPTDPHHPGFSKTVKIYDIARGEFIQEIESPHMITVTTATAVKGDTFYIASGESRPGIRSPRILKGEITQTK